jgi:prepilin signal peptidase PulO-like enzyme (type II secretory pathway)
VDGLTIFALIAAPCMASFGMLMGDRWTPEKPWPEYQRDIAWRPSTCDGCERPVRPWALTPIAGWLAAGGRCACKQQKITPLYPIVEALALLFALLAWRAQGPAFWTLLPAIAGATAAARSDARVREVHETAWLLIAVSALLRALTGPDPLEHALVAMTYVALFVPICAVYIRRGRLPVLPLGDVFLLATLTAMLDFDQSLVFALALAPAIGLVWIMTPRSAAYLPMAPALVYAAAAALLAPPIPVIQLGA